MKPVLILTRGIPGSGKSFWSKQFVVDNPDYVRVNADSIRHMLMYDYKFEAGLEPLVSRLEKEAVVGAIRAGKNVVVDAMGYRNNAKSWKDKLNYLGITDVEIKVQDFTDVPLSLCKERNNQRPPHRKVPEWLLEDMVIKFANENTLNNK